MHSLICLSTDKEYIHCMFLKWPKYVSTYITVNFSYALDKGVQFVTVIIQT